MNARSPRKDNHLQVHPRLHVNIGCCGLRMQQRGHEDCGGGDKAPIMSTVAK